jgi:hypothetical protein
MLFKWQIQRYTHDKARRKTLAEEMQFKPKPTGKLKKYGAYAFWLDHLMDHLVELMAYARKRLSPYLSKLLAGSGGNRFCPSTLGGLPR